MAPEHACRVSLERATEGLDTVSVTGNVLRDYVTDLFPILELGTSAKVLSIVPLLAGGRLYEAGAGGSAPKHVRQFQRENHLRWNSVGEYQAMAEAFLHLGEKTGNKKSTQLGKCLYKAIGAIHKGDEMPGKRVRERDNRNTNFSLALHWADFLARENVEYKDIFTRLSKAQSRISVDIKEAQGRPIDLGGYYLFHYKKVWRSMNPSDTLNEILGKM